MNILQFKLKEYKRLVGCRIEYDLANGDKVEVSYYLENFPHLLGLQKLKDLQLIQFGAIERTER